ncbi:MAG: hypothetical protein LBJ19_00880 [Holosporaceae bacterium]|jgi:hypothetical protein|nr:hypothetical protein [Holosporaceae bacterium]
MCSKSECDLLEAMMGDDLKFFYLKIASGIALVWTVLSSCTVVAVQSGNPTTKTAVGNGAETDCSAAATGPSPTGIPPPGVSTAAVALSPEKSSAEGNSIATSSGAAAAVEKKSESTAVINTSEKDNIVAHWDSLPSLFGKHEQTVLNGQLPKSAIVQSIDKKNDKAASVSLRCYKNLCLVKEIRKVAAHTGLNTVEFKRLYASLMPDSLNFRTPGKGKIKVHSYTFHQKNLTRQGLFQSAIGSDVFFRPDSQSTTLDKGVLMAISNEDGVNHAIIGGRADQKYFIIPLQQCIAIDGKKKSPIDQDSLVLLFESEKSEDIDLELSYLIPTITWKYICIIDVFEKLDRIDIFSQAFVKNSSGFDLDNVPIIFDTSSSIEERQPTDNKTNAKNSDSGVQIMKPVLESSGLSYSRNFSIKNNASSVCVLQSTKEIKPTLEYIAQLPKNFFDEQFPGEIFLQINNLLIVEKAKKVCVDSDDANSYAVIFRRVGEGRSFVSKQIVSSIKKENKFILKMGQASGILATAKQTDFKRLSETQWECGVCVSIKNEKASDSAVLITAEMEVPWNITKTNFEMQKSDNPVWRIEVKAGESKELHCCIRVTRK